MTAIEYLLQLYKDLLVAQNFNITKEQEEAFDFIQTRLEDGEEAEETLVEISISLDKYKGLI